MIHEPLPLFVVMTASVALNYALCAWFRWADRLGITMMVIAFGLVAGNLGIVPQASEVYDPVMGHIIPLAVALFLFRLDFQELRSIKPIHLWFFLFGSLASVLGGLVTFYCLGPKIGPEAWKLTGQLVASYIGGGENAVAVANALEVRHDLFTAAFAADNIVTTIWMMVGLSAPFGLSRFFSKEMPRTDLAATRESQAAYTSVEFLPSFFYSLSAAGIVVLVSMAIAKPIRAYAEFHRIEWLRFNTTIVWVTTLALLLAQTPLRRYFRTAYTIGMLLLLYFFFSMGAVSSIHEIARLGPAIFVFVATIVAVHGALVVGVGRLCKLDAPTIFICSQANIGGPSTAVALAEANGWSHMVTPAILLGVLGYAIANYIGLFLAQLLR
ncbi:MAG: DUF819 family protein [Deltaproteobacteria bacterium]|nr:DUF819 family protein [Deltaproteobacteria bacterium]